MATNKVILKELMAEFLPNLLQAKDPEKYNLFMDYYTKRLLSKNKSKGFAEELRMELSALEKHYELRYCIENEVFAMERLYGRLLDCCVPHIDANGSKITSSQPDTDLERRLDENLHSLYTIMWHSEKGYCLESDDSDQVITVFNVKKFLAQILYEILEAFNISKEPYCGEFICRCRNCNKLIGKTRSDREHCSEECRVLAKSKRQYMKRNENKINRNNYTV